MLAVNISESGERDINDVLKKVLLKPNIISGDAGI